MRESSHVRAIASGRRPQRPRQAETAAPSVGFTTYQQAKILITSSTFSPSSRARPRCDDAAAARLSSSRYCDVCEDVRCVSRRVYTQQRAGLRVHRDRACESRREPRTAALSDAPASSPTPRAATPPAPPCFTNYGHDAERLQTTTRRSASTSLGRRRAATSASCVHPFFVFTSSTGVPRLTKIKKSKCHIT